MPDIAVTSLSPGWRLKGGRSTPKGVAGTENTAAPYFYGSYSINFTMEIFQAMLRENNYNGDIR